MSETDRAPVIRLAVDQEVFMDTVREQDRIDDANVATEVTSFDRVGDAYVLEGAIVFAGYLTRSDNTSQFHNGQEPDALSFELDEGEYVQHIHHRMPFVLRVPVKSQPRGIVNVASRISGWKLSVISAGWIRVVADLNITGLNGHEGYHFQCGAQEEGNLFFHREWQQDTAPQSSQAETKVDATPVEAVPESVAEADFMLVRGHGQSGDKPSADPAPHGESLLHAKMNTVSEARGGHDVEAGAEERSSEAREEDTHSVSSSTRDELANLDRFVAHTPPASETSDIPLHRQSSDGAEVSSDLRGEDTANPSWESKDVDVEEYTHGERMETVAEFEFEHQLSTSDMQANVPEAMTRESFVPSRSFDQEGFHATSGFVPTVHVGAQSDVRSEGPVAMQQDDEEAQDVEVTRKSGLVDADLWTFVDLTAPERFFTLRYAIVMEEETLESLSERLGCAKSDLMRANRMSSETVIPGQTLRIPHSRMLTTK